jgi:hypothetical protein
MADTGMLDRVYMEDLRFEAARKVRLAMKDEE